MRCARVLGLAIILACGTPMGACAEPPAPNDMSAVQLDALKKACEKAADYSADHAGRAVLVMVDGQVVFDRYDNGWSANKPHPLASGTKSFTGVVAAAAVQDGLITWDELAADTIVEWQSDPRKSKITVRHLLTLSSGLDPSDALLGGRGGGRLLGEGAEARSRRLGPEKERPADLFKAAIGVPAKHEPGSKFEYGPAHFYAFGELLERKIQARHAADAKFPDNSFADYMERRVFKPIGLDVAYFGRDAKGHPALPGGCLLTAREWVKFGQFILNEGKVKDKDGEWTQVIDPAILSECFKPSKANPVYGLTWWLNNAVNNEDAALVADTGGNSAFERLRERNRRKQTSPAVGPDGKPIEVYMAAGLGKQRLFVIPQHKLVVVRFAEAAREGARFDNAEFLTPMIEELAKAKESPKP